MYLRNPVRDTHFFLQIGHKTEKTTVLLKIIAKFHKNGAPKWGKLTAVHWEVAAATACTESPWNCACPPPRLAMSRPASKHFELAGPAAASLLSQVYMWQKKIAQISHNTWLFREGIACWLTAYSCGRNRLSYQLWSGFCCKTHFSYAQNIQTPEMVKNTSLLYLSKSAHNSLRWCGQPDAVLSKPCWTDDTCSSQQDNARECPSPPKAAPLTSPFAHQLALA